MLAKESDGMTDRQRHMTSQAERSCDRLAALVADVSDLARLEDGTAVFNSGRLDLFALVEEVWQELRGGSLADLTLGGEAGPAVILGDSGRLRAALIALAKAESHRAGRLAFTRRCAEIDGRRVAQIALGAAGVVEELPLLPAASLVAFDECRGGSGLALPVARRVIETAGGAIWSTLHGGDHGTLLQLPVV
jgi:K+-sensing histidine kinase KdpD